MNLVYDNIVFNIQKAGGISVYWKELIDRILLDESINFTAYEYASAESNIFRKGIAIDSDCLVTQTSSLGLKYYRYKNIKDYSNEKKIFHSSYFRTMYGKNIKNIVTVYDFTYERKFKSLTRYIHIYQKKRAMLKADAIICISENTKKDLLNLYPNLSEKRIDVIHISYDEKSYYKLGIERKKNEVLFVGARSNYKNFDSAVEVISLVDDVILNIVGEPLTEAEENLLNNKLNGRYIIHTHISNLDLNRLYNEAICLFYPSEYEGFGIPILEAMAAGCPVIALNTSSIPEVAGDAGILFSNINKIEMSKTIIKLRENNEYRNNVVQKGTENIKRFSWDKCYRETIALYKDLLS